MTTKTKELFYCSTLTDNGEAGHKFNVEKVTVTWDDEAHTVSVKPVGKDYNVCAWHTEAKTWSEALKGQPLAPSESAAVCFRVRELNTMLRKNREEYHKLQELKNDAVTYRRQFHKDEDAEGETASA